MKPWSAIAALPLVASAVCGAVAPVCGQQFAQHTFNNDYYDLAQRDPTWSAEGTLVYVAELDSGPPVYESLYVVRGWADERDIYFGILNAWDPALSGDARRVVVVHRNWYDGDTDSALWVIDSQNRRVRLTEPTEQDSDPEWFQLANLIAFTSTRSGNADIWSASADGGGEMQVTTNAADDREPSWFPDRRLAFVSNRNGAGGIWVQAVDSEESAVQITTGPDGEPSVSPDGKRIAFESNRGGEVWERHIWIAYDLPLRTAVESTTWGALKARHR